MPAEPGAGFGMLVRGVIVDDQVHLAPGRGFAVDLVEKADELLMPVAAHALADDLAVEHVERGEQGRARHTCFCGLFPDPITASSRSRSPGPSFLAAARDAHQVSQQGFRWRSPRRSRSGAAREPGRPPDACSAISDCGKRSSRCIGSIIFSLEQRTLATESENWKTNPTAVRRRQASKRVFVQI